MSEGITRTEAGSALCSLYNQYISNKQPINIKGEGDCRYFYLLDRRVAKKRKEMGMSRKQNYHQPSTSSPKTRFLTPKCTVDTEPEVRAGHHTTHLAVTLCNNPATTTPRYISGLASACSASVAVH